jgi:MFS family permease
MLGLGRFISGVGTGFSNISAPFYMKEIIPTAVSSRYLLTLQLMINVGAFTPFYVGTALFQYGDWIWRFVFVIPILTNCIQLLLLRLFF